MAAQKVDPDSEFLSYTLSKTDSRRLPTNITVYRKEEIRNTGGQSLADVLDRLPSIDVQKTGALGSMATCRMRGLPSPASCRILIDGQPLGGVSSQFVDLSQIPVDNIEKIEVVRGGSSMVHGANTLGGVIDVITKRHTAEKAHSSFGYQTRSYPISSGERRSYPVRMYNAQLGTGGKGFDTYITGSKYYTGGYQTNSEGHNAALTGNGEYTAQNGTRISLALSRVSQETGDPQGTPIPVDRWDGRREKEPSNRWRRVEQTTDLGRLTLSLPLGESPAGLQTMSYGSRQKYLTRPSSGADPDMERVNQVVGNTTRLQFPGGFSVGGSYERDEELIEGGTPHHAASWGVTVQEHWEGDRCDLIPTVRLDQHSAFGNVVNPRLAIVFRATPNWRLSCSAARSFRAPSFTELYSSSGTLGNIFLRPETAWTYDAGTEWRSGKTFSLKLTGFHSQLRERIAAKSAVYENAPRAEVTGGEAEMDSRWGPFEESINYTYQRAIGNSMGSYRYVPLQMTPRHTANYRLTTSLPRKWRLINTVQYVHHRFQYDNEQGMRFPSYTLWHARLVKKILSSDLYLGVDNITNKRFIESVSTGLVPNVARTYWAGITIWFVD